MFFFGLVVVGGCGCASSYAMGGEVERQEATLNEMMRRCGRGAADRGLELAEDAGRSGMEAACASKAPS